MNRKMICERIWNLPFLRNLKAILENRKLRRRLMLEVMELIEELGEEAVQEDLTTLKALLSRHRKDQKPQSDGDPRFVKNGETYPITSASTSSDGSSK